MSAQTEAPNQNLLKPAGNQLGIIALLTVLIYALASVVIGFSGHIDPSQKWPLVWFLVLFPLLVLGTFGWLVSRHHGKLYSAAAESRTTGFFVTTLTADQQRRKLARSVGGIDGGESLVSATLTTPEAVVESTAAAAGYDARAVYLIAEDLVLRRIELERGPSFRRHITLEGVPFDGLVMKNDKVVAVQVAFMTSAYVKPGFTGTLLDNGEYAATRLKLTRPGSSFTLLLAVVTQMPELEQVQLKSRLIGEFGATPVNIDIEFFDFEQLQHEFTNAGLKD